MDNQLERKNMLWNMIGSMLYALTSMTLGIVVTRLVGDVEGGIFLFAFSTLGSSSILFPTLECDRYRSPI